MNTFKIKKIIKGKNNKFIIMIGPCSINNITYFNKYIEIIKKIINKYKHKIKIIIRVFIEKPRTISGWKGIINDPTINNKFKIKKGIKIAIKILKIINKNKISVITEILNNNIYNIIKKYISCGIIGARNNESQIHREIISNSNIPFGIKNNTNGDIITSINSIKASNFKTLYIKNIYKIKKNKIKIKYNITKGNNNCFIVLRGSNKSPNYYINNIKNTIKLINKNNITTGIIIDCNHGNSMKNYKKQFKVVKYIINNINNNKYKYINKIKGFMIESYIKNNKQIISNKINKLISITDTCISIKESYDIIKYIYNNIKLK